MKNILLCILCTVNTLFGQSKDKFACNYFGKPDMATSICPTRNSFKNNEHAEKVVDKILKPIGLTRNFAVQNCPNVDNCFAVIENGKRYIVYDNTFMSKVESYTQSNWSAIAIMAHEIGHHLQGHTLDGLGSRPQKELEADKFSGFVLHQMGATMIESQSALKIIHTEEGTSNTHPGKKSRLIAVAKGWEEAEELYPILIEKKGNTIDLSERNIAATKLKTGCISGNCNNGFGQYVHEIQGSYIGEWEYGSRQGFGTYYNSDGIKVFEGQYKKGKRDGYGIYYFKNGDKYEGQFKTNKINGKGIYYYKTGESYEGEFNEEAPQKGLYSVLPEDEEIEF